jgi:hypothetical protein
MAKLPINYNKAVLYKIFNRVSNKVYYYGYTTNFTEKKKIIRKKIKYSTDPIYFQIRDCPKEELGVVIVKKIPCDDKFTLDNIVSDLNFKIKRHVYIDESRL